MTKTNLFLLSLLFSLALSPAAFAQETRGSLTGVVSDATGAAVAGARVEVRNNDTNVSSTNTTNSEGVYFAPFLLPGRYAVLVEAPGYKKLVRSPVVIRVEDKLKLDLTLEVGEVSETVTVTASGGATLETGTGSFGQVIDGKALAELPLPDGNPFTLARLAPGMFEDHTGSPSLTGQASYINTVRIGSNGLASSQSGGTNGNSEFTLDGAPNTGYGGRLGYSPPSDSVEEFKILTNSFDASNGRAAGAMINVATKSGKNRLFGTASDFVRNDVIAANTFLNNRLDLDRPPLRYNRYSATVGGPVAFPKKVFGPFSYDGRNRTFFFFAYEGQRDKQPRPKLITVPTEAQRRGDFSALLAANIRIYDPATAVEAGARVRRTAFANNIIPTNRISPLALSYLNYFPLPNAAGDAEGRGNFYTADPAIANYNSQTVRIDHAFSERQRSYWRYSHNGNVNLNQPLGTVNNIVPIGQRITLRHHGLAFDHVYTASARTVFNLRVSGLFQNESAAHQSQGNIDATTLGFTPRALGLFETTELLPRATIQNYQEIGGGLGEYKTHTVWALQPNVTHVWGSQTIKAGYEGRFMRENFSDNSDGVGRYAFAGDFTRELDNSPNLHGQGLAAFLLGITTSGQIFPRPNRANQQFFHAFYLQDDWKASRRLTLNLGLRYEYEPSPTERFNRSIRGFDLTSPTSPTIETAVRAAYAAIPAASRPAEVTGAFPTLRGGYLFANPDNRTFYTADKNNFQPRFGFAYQLNQKTVLRGGFGVYHHPYGFREFENFDGFTVTTTLQASDNRGLNFNPALNRPCAITCGTFADPYPNGVVQPSGSSQGLATFVGRGVTALLADEVSNPIFRRWQFSVQRQLPGQIVVEAAYVGQRGSSLPNTRNINATPAQYLSKNGLRDDANIAYLTTQFTNPFRGILPADTTLGRNATLDRERFLRPFPQFEGVSFRSYEGTLLYHALQTRAERRFNAGYSLSLSYTWSRAIDERSYLNAVDPKPERRIAISDLPHRLAVTGILEFPFGRGKKLLANLPGVVDALIGGWQLSGIYQYQSGLPLDMPNVYFNGDSSQLRTLFNGNGVVNAVCPRGGCPQNANQTNNIFGIDLRTSGFYLTDDLVRTNGELDLVKQRSDLRIRLDRNLRVLPSRHNWLRGDNRNNVDLSLSKRFFFSGERRTYFQLRVEAINAFNHPLYTTVNLDPTSAAFATVSAQHNLPRFFQIGGKLVF